MKGFRQFVRKMLPSWFVIQKGSVASGLAYLSFDDGPTHGVTDALLDLLKRYDVQATFFVVGKKLEENWELGERLVAEGHLVGNHSYDHIAFGRKKLPDQVWQVTTTNNIIEKLGQGYRGFRSPQGYWSGRLLIWLAMNRFRAIHWNYDSLDYTIKEANKIIRNFDKRPVKGGDILLFHDDSSLCIEVLEEMLPRWKSQGLKFGLLKDL